MRRLLDDLPCVVSEATSGRAGVQRARQEPPDAILLDLAMPDVSGEEVLEQLRADNATARIPVVIVTSKVLEDAERRRLSELAIAIVDKATDRKVAARQIRTAFTAAAVFEK
jgi:CheY-like chemotaxis protein